MLSSLLCDIRARIIGEPHVEVAGVTADSRLVGRGWVFVAVRGTHQHGDVFIGDAITRGASVVVAERVLDVPRHITMVVVDNSLNALSVFAAAFYGYPQRGLRLIGVTGTDGKTSVACLIAGMLEACGRPCGYLGTLGGRFAGKLHTTHHTTPPPPELHAALRWLADLGAESVAMEASSHSLHQGRLRGLSFEAAVFTTFGRDHLDYHHTPEEYLRAKLMLLDQLVPHGRAVVNGDDPILPTAVRAQGCSMVTFSAQGRSADVVVRSSRMSMAGTEVELWSDGQSAVVRSGLLGSFQVENLAAAAATGLALGLTMPEAVEGLQSVRRIPGRFEPVVWRGMAWAVVDYAHTPQALERALRSARAVAEGKVLVVFGCGGDRDRGKRPLMGSVASRLADTVLLTSDNPRSEDPSAIIRQIAEGMDGPASVVIQPDRKAALNRAAAWARPGDLVLVAGKGHETTQTVGDVVLPFNDAEVLASLWPGCGRNVA